MPRPFVFLAPARPIRTIRTPHTTRALRGIAVAGTFASTLALSGCYYYYPYGYGYGYGATPAYATQQETAVGTVAAAPGNTPAPNAVPDAQYPGPLYSTQPVAIAVPAYSAWPAYYPAYYPAWGWGAPAVSFGFGWGGHWH